MRPTTRRWHRYKLTTWVFAHRVLAFGATGANGMMLATEFVESTDLSEVSNDRLASLLNGVWSQVATLHRAGIAHRHLRLDNLMVDDNDQVWMVDFAGAEVVADEVQLTDDVIELLASTAAVVGPEIAVDAALGQLGRRPLVDALSRLQPLAVTPSTREELSKDGFKKLRSEVATHLHRRSTGHRRTRPV